VKYESKVKYEIKELVILIFVIGEVSNFSNHIQSITWIWLQMQINIELLFQKFMCMDYWMQFSKKCQKMILKYFNWILKYHIYIYSKVIYISKYFDWQFEDFSFFRPICFTSSRIYIIHYTLFVALYYADKIDNLFSPGQGLCTRLVCLSVCLSVRPSEAR
jgi:hypothetical protein